MAHTRFWSALAASFFMVSAARAVPNAVTQDDTDDDARIELTVLDQVIIPDTVSFCSVNINVDDDDEGWTNGDTVEVWVYEDDPIGDEEIFYSGVITINTASDIQGGRFIRTWDCSGLIEEDGTGAGDEVELYAEALIEKDECGTFCRYDRPQTSNIDAAETADDVREENDDGAGATPIPAGRTNDFVSVDADFLSRSLSQISSVQFDILHRTDVGRLDGRVVDAAGQDVPFTSSDLGDRTRIDVPALPLGAASLIVTPRDAANPNFYDINVVENVIDTECTPGDTEALPCGNCGGQERTCTSFGMWETGEACLNQGECAQGASETEACDGGAERTRSCSNACEWDDFGECFGGSCEGNETISCYTGEPSSEGIGPCTGGTRTCENGTFSDCVGEVVPRTEICGNGIDDDCDDDDDLRDDDCDNGLALLGEPCDGDDECDAQWTCLGDPEPDRFIDGYCGDDQACSGEANECTADGVCADLGDSDYCLLKCGDGIGCRFGYTCATLDEGSACIPRCRDDNDCFFDDAGTCNVGTGLCEGPDGPSGNGGDTDVAEIGGCDCSTGPTTGWAFLGGLGLLLVGLGRRRR